MSVETITLGCRLNFAEAETIAATAQADEDWIVVNSCAVTNEAVRQTRQAIRQSHRKRPEAKILVTGCAAELDPTRFAAMPEVTRVVGNATEVGTGTERTLAGARQHDHAHRIILTQLIEDRGAFRAGLNVQRVALIRTIDRNDSDAFAALNQNGLV